MSEEDPSILIVDRLPLVNDLRVITHPLKMGELRLKNGSIVEIKSIENGKTIYAPIYAATNFDDNGDDINNLDDPAPKYGFIQISRCLRINLQCFLGQKVKITKADEDMIDSAECVVLAPIEDTISINDDPSNTISGTYADILFQFNFKNLPLKKNQVIPIYALNRIIEFKVVIAQPTKVVLIDDIDVIACKNTTVPRGKSPHFDEVNYDDIGGLNSTIRKIRQVIELPLLQPRLYRSLLKNANNSKSMDVRGLLITANSGCGKTLISTAIRNETPANFLRIDCYDLLTKTVEQAIAFLLKKIEEAVSTQPAIVYFDDFDSVASPEINENAQPDSRISNALCSALKRLRAEKGVAVIAAARDDSRIRKDIKAKFDRKVNIMYPIGQEKLSILRAIALRHPIDLSLASNLSSVLLSGKSSAQLTSTAMRIISKSIAELSFQIKSEKKNRRNSKNKKKGDNNDGEPLNDSEFVFSINQLKKVAITKNLVNNDGSPNLDSDMKGDEDDLFEDASFDSPDRFKPSIANEDFSNVENETNINNDKNNRRVKPYDPDFEFYFSPVEPIRTKKKGRSPSAPESGFDVVNLFEGEPLYNEGISDESMGSKKRYTYDDEDADERDYYSDEDDYRQKGRNNKNKGKGNKGGKNNQKGGKGRGRNRRDDYDYYDDDYYYDYYDDDYYYDDDEDDRRRNKNAKNKKNQNKNFKPKGKGGRRNEYSDEEDFQEDNRNRNKQQNQKNKNSQKGRRIDPFSEKANDQEYDAPNFPPQKGKAGNRNNRNDAQPPPKGKRDFVDPFGQRDNQRKAPPQMPTKKGALRMANPFERQGGGAATDAIPRRKRGRDNDKEIENEEREDVEDSGPSPFKSDESEEPTNTEQPSQEAPPPEPEPEPEPERPPPPKPQPVIDGLSRRRKNPFGKANPFGRAGADDSDDDDDGQFGNVERKDPFANSAQDDDEDEANSKQGAKRNEAQNDEDKGGKQQPKKASKKQVQRTPFADDAEEERNEEDDGPRRRPNKKNSLKRQAPADLEDEDEDNGRNRNRNNRNRNRYEDEDDEDDEEQQQPQRKRMPSRRKNPFG